MAILLKYGNTNTYLVRGVGGSLLIDTDYAGTLPGFYRAIKAAGVRLGDIDYVLATHYHPDHMGLIGELMQQGVKLLLLEHQRGQVHFSDAIFAHRRSAGYRDQLRRKPRFSGGAGHRGRAYCYPQPQRGWRGAAAGWRRVLRGRCGAARFCGGLCG